MSYVYTPGTSGATTPESAAVNASYIQQQMRSSGGSASPLDGVNSSLVNDVYRYNQSTNASQLAAADRANNFSAEQAQLNRIFNAQEAQKTREWQEYMSNTAHQREVKDLLAAGLNPILSANNGASAYSGASASSAAAPTGQRSEVSDYTQALVSLLGTMLSNQTNLLNGMVSAEASKAVADKYNATSEMLGLLNAEISRYGIDVGAANTQYASDSNRAAAAMSAGAVLGAASTSAAAAMYGADQSLLNSREQREWQAAHPQNAWQAAGTTIDRYGSSLLDKIGSLASRVTSGIKSGSSGLKLKKSSTGSGGKF